MAAGPEAGAETATLGPAPDPAATASPAAAAARPIGLPAFLGVVVTSFGGPLALAALYVPSILTDTSAAAGLLSLSGAVVFGIPLAIWLGYARRVATPGGLYGFVRAAAGPRLALLQAALWVTSYALYLVYTSAAIVYDTLPAVLPGVTRYRSLLEIAVPVVLATVMIAGRTTTLAVVGALAVGQLVLVGALAAVAIAHASPAQSFAVPAPSRAVGAATGQIALLYVCGSLPLFLGGEVARPTRTVPRGLVLGYLLTAAGVVAAVFPIAADPAFTHAPIPGMSIAQVFGDHSLAVAIGLGVAASTAGVMLVEYLALSRLLHVLTRQSVRATNLALGGLLVGTAPLTLVDPQRVYSALLKPSLIALWLSQLIVFAAYPAFARRHARRRITDIPLAAGAVVFTLYGVLATVQHAGT